ncbi:MAG: trypsin-like serine protease [Chloroflexota bacterium]|nr:trypsin-like serine protease [Chloroflexota bacterium]MDP9470111.1 trypsin-like serine protease [Chloroflexota bacterium]
MPPRHHPRPARRRISRAATLLGLLAVLLATTSPVAAGTGGRPTGNAHPAVGALVVAQPPRFGPVAWCSGVLLTPTIFLTAAHCTTVLHEPGATLLGVTFDPSFNPDTSPVLPGTVHIHPAYDPATPDASRHDLAVIHLAEAPEGIAPASLPSGDLTPMKAGFTAVGYGGTGFLTASAGGCGPLTCRTTGSAAPLP